MQRIILIIIALAGLSSDIPGRESGSKGSYLSPAHICVSEDKGEAYISLSTSFRIAVVDINKNKCKDYIDLPFNPGGLVLSRDSKTLIVADKEPEGKVHFISTRDGQITKSHGVGHTPDAMAQTSDGSLLFVANRFSNSVSVIDVKSNKLVKTIAVDREPVKIVISPDDQTVAVANLIPNSAADDPYVSSTISLIDINSLEITQNIKLANGSQSIKGLAFSGNGKHLYATHILSRNNLPTSQIQYGWINSNAISIIDTDRKAYITSFLLDNYNKGAANPSDIILSKDGKQLFIALSGVHELCIIDLPELHALLDASVASKLKSFPNDLTALYEIKDRIPVSGKLPQFLAGYKGNILVSSYFSTFLEVFDTKNLEDVKTISLGSEPDMDNERKGELYFHDADLCFQEWQSCSSCHPDARADGLNWDLMNDGAGNTKNGKSLLYSHYTPPAMITGIRDKAETAVRSGIKYILFSEPEEPVAEAIDSYLKSLEAVPSPFLSKGSLSRKAERGKQLFIETGCKKCHSGKYFTDMKKYDVGTGLGVHEKESFDVPALSEVWRTAPYLYDGRAKTMMEVFTKFNPDDAHGLTGNLSEEDLDCLVEYVLCL